MAPRKKTQKQQAEELISAAYPTKRTKKNLKKSRDFAKSYRKATTVPLKLTLAWSDADEAYQKGKNTSRESALLKRLLAAKKAVQNAQKKINKSTGQNARPSTAGQRREASRLFGRQEQTVEHEGRLGRIPGSVVGPNERFKRVTKEDKQKAADVTGLGLEIASYGIGAGQMIGLITGAAKFLTGAAAKLFAKKGGEKNLSQAMIKKANKAARAAKSKTTPKNLQTTAAQKSANRRQQSQTAKPPAKTTSPKTPIQTAVQSGKNILGVAKGKTVKTPPGGSGGALRNAQGQLRSVTKKQQLIGNMINKFGPAIGPAALLGTLTIAELNERAEKASLSKDIKQADAKRTAKADIASAEKTAAVLKSEDRRQQSQRNITKSEPKAEAKVKTKRSPADNAREKYLLNTLDRVPPDKRDFITKKMEKLLGLNRSSAQIKKDVEETDRLEKDLLMGGGRVRKKVVQPTKKYAMNRGGVASVRKPTRA
tara:strand:- start:2621 stop:4066 length:1446 start_codon:yes stop_codon:yes gene_type:complete